MLRTVLVICVFLSYGCSQETLIPTTPILKITETYTPPSTHPKFIKDTTWIEDDMRMVMWPPDSNWTLDIKPWSYQIVTDTNDAVRKGWKSQRFEVRFGDCVGTDCERGPVWERREFGQADGSEKEPLSLSARQGDEFWYGWSFYAPNQNRNSFNWVYISQFQQTPNNNAVWMFLKREGKPLCLLFEPSKNKNHDCYKDTSFELIPDHLFMGRWHDLVVHAKWEKDSSGIFQVWVNGELKVNYTGYTMANESTSVPFKYGIYRQIESSTSVLYFDEIRRRKTRDSVDIRMLEK